MNAKRLNLFKFLKINILDSVSNWLLVMIPKDKGDKLVRIYFFIGDRFEELQLIRNNLVQPKYYSYGKSEDPVK